MKAVSREHIAAAVETIVTNSDASGLKPDQITSLVDVAACAKLRRLIPSLYKLVLVRIVLDEIIFRIFIEKKNSFHFYTNFF